jgi:hypothetical protein
VAHAFLGVEVVGAAEQSGVEDARLEGEALEEGIEAVEGHGKTER